MTSPHLFLKRTAARRVSPAVESIFMNSADDDKLEEYAKLAGTLRKVHEATGGSSTLWSDESFFAIKGDDGREYFVGAPWLYLAAAEAIENLVARAKEAREDF